MPEPREKKEISKENSREGKKDSRESKGSIEGKSGTEGSRITLTSIH